MGLFATPDDRRRFLMCALAGGAIAGLLDIIYAIVWSAPVRPAIWILQSVASGWLGKAAFQGGIPAAALGLASHFAICIVAAGVYGLAAMRLRWLREHWLTCGFLFGWAVYLFMNYVVLPLSAFPFKLSHPPPILALGFLSHGLLVGIPIAFFFRALRPAPAPAAASGSAP